MMRNKIIKNIATCGFLGSLPCPGTVGSAFSLLLFPMYMYDNSIYLIAFTFFLGVYVSNEYSKALGEHDHKSIIIDEVVGQTLTLYIILGYIKPISRFHMGYSDEFKVCCEVMVSFAGFRLFDIWKPWPISWMDREIKGGWGIMLDDIAAALFFILFFVFALVAVVFLCLQTRFCFF